jgi:hypothetical protein
VRGFRHDHDRFFGRHFVFRRGGPLVRIRF